MPGTNPFGNPCTQDVAESGHRLNKPLRLSDDDGIPDPEFF